MTARANESWRHGAGPVRGATGVGSTRADGSEPRLAGLPAVEELFPSFFPAHMLNAVAPFARLGRRHPTPSADEPVAKREEAGREGRERDISGLGRGGLSRIAWSTPASTPSPPPRGRDRHKLSGGRWAVACLSLTLLARSGILAALRLVLLHFQALGAEGHVFFFRQRLLDAV